MSSKELKKLMDAVAMTKQEIENFLSFPRLARIATISKGKPHIAPVWYFYDGTNIVIPATKETKKIKNIKNNPNVSIAIDIVEGNPEDISYLNAKAVIIEGKAEMKDDIKGLFARKMYERYAGKDALENPMVQFSISMPRNIIVIKPIKIISWDLGKVPKMGS